MQSMKKLLFILLLLTNLLIKADDLYSINSNLSLTCDPTFSEVGEYDLDSFGFIVASTGICQFGEYQIEFFKNLRAGTAHLCDDQPYCGVQADWKGASWNIDTIVKDSSGTIVFENIIDDYEGGYGDAILLDPSSFTIPYLVLQTKGGRYNYFHIFSAKPNFHKVLSIGPLSYSNKGIYTNNLKQIFVDIGVTTLPPDHPSMANIVYYPITMKLVDNHFVPAVEQMKSDLKVYTKDDMQKIYTQAEQINALITKYVFNPEVAVADDEEWEWRFDKIKTHYQLSVLETVYQKFMLGDIYQLGFMRTFISLVREGRIDLAWEFFDLAIPSAYDKHQEYNLPIYRNKKIMKETINNWLTSLEYWDEIEQLNEESFSNETAIEKAKKIAIKIFAIFSKI